MRFQAGLAASCLVGVFAFAGCGGASDQPDPKALQAQIDKLETENKLLREQLNVALETSSKADQTLASQQAFSDVDDEIPHAKLINQWGTLVQGGLKDGSKELQPYEPITRAEFVRWLFKTYNRYYPDGKILPAPPGASAFKDLTKDHPDFKYIQGMANAGYSVGYADKTFKPDQPITREEALAIKVPLDAENNVYGNCNSVDLKFGDYTTIDCRYAAAIYTDTWGAQNIKQAFGEIRNLKPKEPLMRHEAATMMWKVQKKTAEDVLKAEVEKS